MMHRLLTLGPDTGAAWNGGEACHRCGCVAAPIQRHADSPLSAVWLRCSWPSWPPGAQADGSPRPTAGGDGYARL